MTGFCKDCHHVRVKETRQHICKRNCVYRKPLDACLLKTQFERRTLDDLPKDIVEELEREFVGNKEVLNKIAELKNKWCWY